MMFATYIFLHVLLTNSMVGIVTHDRLDGLGIILVGGGGISLHIQTGPGTHLTSGTMDTRVLSLGPRLKKG